MRLIWWGYITLTTSRGLQVGMGEDWAQRTNIFSPIYYKYRCCAICDYHNHFSYEVKLPLQPAILQLQRHLLDLIL